MSDHRIQLTLFLLEINWNGTNARWVHRFYWFKCGMNLVIQMSWSLL